MKEAIAILTGGGPAPGMNTVVGSVAKTFLAKGYRVIGLHYGYSGLFNPSPRYEDLTFTQADYDAYIRLLTEAGFVRQEDEEEENLFTAVNDAGIVVIVYHLHGVTTVCCMTAQSSL